MLKRALIPLALIAAIGAGSAQAASGKPDMDAADAPPPGHASISFANLPHRISNWKADGNKAILIEAPRGTWYRAEFMAPCISLPFAVTVGFVTDSMNQIDKFGSILVGRDRCWFKSFERVPAPAKTMKDEPAADKE